MKRFTTISLTLMLLVGLLVVPAQAETPENIEASIAAGVAYLASMQKPDGSIYHNATYRTTETCLALVKLQERAHDLNLSPFDPSYEYSDEIVRGWQYLVPGIDVQSPLPVQAHGDPDVNGNGYGLYFAEGSYTTYTTGICAMALASTGTPNRPNDAGVDFNGDGSADTYLEIAQEFRDWLAFAQVDSGSYRGGWRYYANYGSSDNSVSGYAVLGLSYVENFGCAVPAWVKTELDRWINFIQCGDGGSGYTAPCSWNNELKTGNLIFQMSFVDGPGAPSTARFQNALAYIERHWRDQNVDPGWGYNRSPAEYQAMYCLMKGLDYSGVDLLDTDGDTDRDDDWFNQEPPALPAQDFASVIVAQQYGDGSWRNCRYGDLVLCTAWALLTLEKVAPPPPQPDLWAVEYRWGPPPAYSFEWPWFKGRMNVRIENRGGVGGDAFNVTAEVMSWPPNTHVEDGSVTVGNIPAGGSAWSTDTFETWVDMSNPGDPCDEVFWRIEYDDAAGVHHVVENVPEFPPGEGPAPCP